MQDAKNCQKVAIWVPLYNFVGLYLHNKGTYQQLGKKLLSINTCSTCPNNMVNFGLIAAAIDPVVWGTTANFNGFRLLAALLHGSQELGISQTVRRWTEGATYIRQSGHHVGHWPTFLVLLMFVFTGKLPELNDWLNDWLWSPYVIGQTIIFMVALCNRADHNIFIL